MNCSDCSSVSVYNRTKVFSTIYIWNIRLRVYVKNNNYYASLSSGSYSVEYQLI